MKVSAPTELTKKAGDRCHCSEKPAAGPFGFLAKRNAEIEALKKQLAAIDKNSIVPPQVRLAEIAKRRDQIDREQAALDAQKLLP
jgi:hypothetical protein